MQVKRDIYAGKTILCACVALQWSPSYMAWSVDCCSNIIKIRSLNNFLTSVIINTPRYILVPVLITMQWSVALIPAFYRCGKKRYIYIRRLQLKCSGPLPLTTRHPTAISSSFRIRGSSTTSTSMAVSGLHWYLFVFSQSQTTHTEVNPVEQTNVYLYNYAQNCIPTH